MTIYDKVVIMQRIMKRILSLILLSVVSIPGLFILGIGCFSLWIGEWEHKGDTKCQQVE